MTLIELMMVIAIMALLLAIGVPKFALLIRQANEGSTQGKLGAIRGALSIYYADMEGVYPSDLTPMMTPGSKYLTGMIPVYTQDHGNSTMVNYYDTVTYDGDGGGWGYVNNVTNGQWGKIWVDCTHSDAKGTIWTQY
jgi:prepilin-type N-terminal cleavage/methylation domain-containing protein